KHIIARIDSAHRSIDAALYSLSGNVGIAIRDALIRAKNRGLHVRMICEADNDGPSTGTVFNQLRSVGIPVINDTFDPINAGAGLMHNKFFVIDGRGGAPDSIWVWTGSWNPTDPGTTGDYQNSIEIQDPALAGAYTIEFDEMWGSDGDVPNASLSRFGARKLDNTPHRFVIGGRDVECYFSPSDRTTSHIIETLAGAEHSIAASLLTLTRSDIASTILAAKNAGKKARVIVDNNTDQGSQADYLKNNGVDLLLKPSNITVLFHHKYGIVDGEDRHWNGTVMTGSHNWTSSAENSNNENLLILHDPVIANQYLQEFAQRYQEFGGQDLVTVGVSSQTQAGPLSFGLEQNYPNPFNPKTVIRGQWTGDSWVKLVVYDVLGREVAILANGRYPAGVFSFNFDGTNLATGVYFYQLEAAGFVQVKKMTLVK
ncbi:MAG: phospholipase D-like domain-containing protein, partial [Bacteroidota bacterium]